MIAFRKATAGAAVTNWNAFGDEVISFSRGDKGHIVINSSADTVEGAFMSNMSPGEYCNVIAGGTAENDCNGSIVLVDDDGVLQISIAPMSAVAIHN